MHWPEDRQVPDRHSYKVRKWRRLLHSRLVVIRRMSHPSAVAHERVENKPCRKPSAAPGQPPTAGLPWRFGQLSTACHELPPTVWFREAQWTAGYELIARRAALSL